MVDQIFYASHLQPRRILVSLMLLFMTAVSAAFAQDDLVKDLEDEYAKLERDGIKENVIRRLSFIILQEYLPQGTRMTSGYRSPQKQLDLILRMARAYSIPTPATADVDDPKTWWPALTALRQKGFIIAAPTTTPHGTEEAVFDLSGANLKAIQEGCERAKKAGMITFKRIIPEPRNNAIHVEVDSVSPKAFHIFGKRRTDSPGSGTQGAGGTIAPPSESDQRRSMLQQLQNLHDREPDPAKKIDYDRSKRNLLDPAVDSVAINALNNEVEQHQREAQQLEDGGQRRQVILRVSEALREGRYEDAESEAADFADALPNSQEAQNMLVRIKTHRLVSEARDALEGGACGECEQADALIESALELSPDHEGAQLIREEVDDCLKECRVKRISIAVLGMIVLFVFAGSIVVYFLLSRPGNWLSAKVKGGPRWALEVIEGPRHGQVFPLHKEEMVIGSQGPPAGPSDIEICDDHRKISRRHCSIMHNGKRFYLIDESTNGTKINDREIEKGVLTEFRQGDRISLADVAILWLKQQ